METQKIKQYKSLPIVLRNYDLGQVYVIYRNRIEMYGKIKDGFQVQTKTELDKLEDWGDEGWTPEHEVEMAIGSGFKRVQDSDNDSHWKYWDAEKIKEVQE
jgi:hypothetical protein